MAKNAPRLSTTPKTDKARERLWAAQSAISTLQEAKRIQTNPSLLRDARTLATEQAKALKSITNKR